jgi:Rps23 Pro-64 3,4-dihydroxylase Tpa1-like proline 4-hydroxylase
MFNDAVTFETMQIQRYTKSKGKYIFHNDFKAEFEKKQYRIITYLWYINTVDEGGETEIWNNYKVKPEVGKLILFPATWTYPHRGKVPISNDKYIITGWIYEQSK